MVTATSFGHTRSCSRATVKTRKIPLLDFVTTTLPIDNKIFSTNLIIILRNAKPAQQQDRLNVHRFRKKVPKNALRAHIKTWAVVHLMSQELSNLYGILN